VQDSLNRPLDVHAANLTATLALLEASAKQSVKRFIFSSSASIYGDTLGNPAEENFKPDPLSHYAVQKLASENYCAVYDRLHGIETVCLRYFNVYGPRQRADSPYSGVIAKFTTAARNGMPLKIYGDGLQTRDFVHVNDVAYANLLSAKLPSRALSSRVFNVGSGKSISVKDLALEILKNFSGSAQIEYHQAQAAQIRFSESNISLAKKVLNYQPLIDLPEGIASLVA
jgi:UDP-glucose 4-epimerase